MAIKRFGFNDNFLGSGGKKSYGRPDAWQYAQNTKGRQQFGAPDPWQYATGIAKPPPPKITPVAAPAAGAPGTAPVKPATPAPRVGLDDPEILSDPILMKVKKAQETRRGDIRAGALARKKQLAIQTGDSGLAREFGLDDTVAQVAAQNPLSAFAAIRDAAKAEEFDLDEGLNKANLYFGGYRGTQLGELAKSILAREANAQAQARQAYSAIEDELLGGLGSADDAEMQAEMAAYDRAVARRAAGLAGSGGVPAADAVSGAPASPTAPPAPPTLVDLRPFTDADPYAGSGRDALVAELAGIRPSAQPEPVALQPFTDADPYAGSGLAAVRAELASIPQAASTPPPLPLVPPAPTFAPPVAADPLVAELLRPADTSDPVLQELLFPGGSGRAGLDGFAPAPAPVAAPAAAAPAIRDIVAELASIPQAPAPAPAPVPAPPPVYVAPYVPPQPVYTPPPAPAPVSPIVQELMAPRVDPRKRRAWAYE